jgi:hypothetical protein
MYREIFTVYLNREAKLSVRVLANMFFEGMGVETPDSDMVYARSFVLVFQKKLKLAFPRSGPGQPACFVLLLN